VVVLVIRVFKFLLLAYLVAFSQTILSDLTSILGIAPNFGTIIILLIALRTEYHIALPTSFAVALIIDALSPETLGLGTAVRFAIAVAVSEIRQHLDIEQLPAQLYLLIGSEICFQTLFQALANSFDLGILSKIYLETSLPTLVYTVVVGFVVLVMADLEFKLEIRRRGLG
jgi:cell shape-determining protein MreD